MKNEPADTGTIFLILLVPAALLLLMLLDWLCSY
jgi:hypothetical protein